MDSDQARGLYGKTGVILCLEAPKDETLEVGIDNNSWLAGPKFQGLKLIPAGIHLFFYSVRSKHGGDSAPRTSVFMNFEAGDIKVLKWDSKGEQFEILGRDEAAPYVKGVQEFAFDGSLGAYPQERLDKWKALSSFLTVDLCNKIQPLGAFIAATGKALTKDEQRQIGEAMEDIGVEEKELSKENFLLETPCYFSEIPRSVLPPNATPAQITLANMDKTAVLNKIAEDSHKGNWNRVLGELQFAFVCFLLGQSFEAFEQWKKLLAVLLACESAMYEPERQEFWSDFLSLLEVHLKEAPEDFFFDIVEGNNFLHASLVDFFEITQDERLSPDLREQVEEFKLFVEDKFGIPFETEAYDEEE